MRGRHANHMGAHHADEETGLPTGIQMAMAKVLESEPFRCTSGPTLQRICGMTLHSATDRNTLRYHSKTCLLSRRDVLLLQRRFMHSGLCCRVGKQRNPGGVPHAPRLPFPQPADPGRYLGRAPLGAAFV